MVNMLHVLCVLQGHKPKQNADQAIDEWSHQTMKNTIQLTLF